MVLALTEMTHTEAIQIEEAQRLFDEGEVNQAKRAVEALLARKCESAGLLFLAARIQELLGDEDGAREFLQRALKADPELLAARLLLASLLRRRRDFDGCMDELSYVLYRDPNNESAYFELAFVHRLTGDTESAIAFLEKALSIKPDDPKALVELGSLYLKRERLDEAVSLLERAAEIDPLGLPDENILASAYVKREEYERAVKLFSKLCANTPDSLLWPRLNLGSALDHLGEYERAEPLYEHILRYEPNNFAARWNRAHLLLARHDFKQGWEGYQYRMQLEAVWKPMLIPFEPWKGQDLGGKHIVVGAEQGLGDQIMFASCLPDLIERSGKVTLECDRRLASLFSRSFPAATVIGSRYELKPRWLRDVRDANYYIPAGSLPGFFRKCEADFPQHSGYLKADSEKVASWRRRLSALGPGIKVGLSWRGGTSSTRRRLRTLQLAALEPILQVPNCHFVSLQYGDCKAEIEEVGERFNVKLAHWQDAIDDYDETAALCCALDLSISVCTSVIHLNGALGREVWVLVPAAAEWRYGRTGSRMPWYPSARLFRQAGSGSWEPTLDEVAALLRERTGTVRQ